MLTVTLDELNEALSPPIRNAVAITTCPRYISTEARNVLEYAFGMQRIPVAFGTGPHWFKSITSMIEGAIVGGVEHLICVDSDSLVTPSMIEELFRHMPPPGSCLCAGQAKRNSNESLANNVLGVETGHFGFTMFHAADFAAVEKPWFMPIPNKDGEWHEGSYDPDMAFWLRWAEAGKSIVTPNIASVGQIEECVIVLDAAGEVSRMSVTQWKDKFLRE